MTDTHPLDNSLIFYSTLNAHDIPHVYSHLISPSPFVLTHSHSFPLVPTYSHSFSLISTRFHLFPLIPTCSHLFPLVLTCSHSFPLVPTHFDLFSLVSTRSHSFPLVHTFPMYPISLPFVPLSLLVIHMFLHLVSSHSLRET